MSCIFPPLGKINIYMFANLSRQISLYLAGNWSEGFDETLEALRAAVLRINSIWVDLSLTEGLSSWISSAFSYFKEWVGVGLFGVVTCCGLVFMLWLVCKLRTQHTNDKVVIAQALAAIEQGPPLKFGYPCLRINWHLSSLLLRSSVLWKMRETQQLKLALGHTQLLHP